MARSALMLEEALELAELLGEWGDWKDRLRNSGVPVMLGDDDDSDDDSDSDDDDQDRDTADADDDSDSDDDSDDDSDSDDDDDDATRIDWKAQSRRHEREKKKLAKRVKAMEEQERKRADARKSDQEKAVEKARREGREEAERESARTRREDRLESRVSVLASRGIEIELDGRTEKIKFADPDDALIHIKAALSKGDLDADELFTDDHRVDDAVLTEALGELLQKKAHLRGDASSGQQKSKKTAKGGSDAGRGKGGAKSLDDMSVEDHLKEVQQGNK